MTTTINASPTNGIVQTADGSGVMKLQSNGVTTNALAWVKFAGATGTVSTSYNVTSVTRTSTGLYTVNIATATTDANYAIVGTVQSPNTGSVNYQIGQLSNQTNTTSAFSFYTANSSSNAATDCNAVYIAVFGN